MCFGALLSEGNQSYASCHWKFSFIDWFRSHGLFRVFLLISEAFGSGSRTKFCLKIAWNERNRVSSISLLATKSSWMCGSEAVTFRAGNERWVSLMMSIMNTAPFAGLWTKREWKTKMGSWWGMYTGCFGERLEKESEWEKEQTNVESHTGMGAEHLACSLLASHADKCFV